MIRKFFWAALAVTLTLLLLPAKTIVRLKVWVYGWLPFAARIDAMDLSNQGDKLVHLGLFAALGFLAVWAWRLPGQVYRPLLGLLAMAPATEVLQHWVPGRSASLLDLLADGVGLALGVMLARASLRLQST